VDTLMIESPSKAVLNTITLSQLELKSASNLYSLLVISDLINDNIDEPLRLDCADTISIFQSLKSGEQVALQQAALDNIESFIARCQNTEQLKPLTDIVVQALDKQKSDIHQLISLLSPTLVTKLSLANPLLAKQILPIQIKNLSPDELLWLNLVISGGQLVTQIQLGDKMLRAPTSTEKNFSTCCQLLALAQGDKYYATHILKLAKSQIHLLGEDAKDLLLKAETTINQFSHSKMQSEFYSHASKSIHWVYGHDDVILAKLKSWSTVELAWSLYTLSTGQPPSGAESIGGTKLSLLAQLAKVYSREQVIHVLNNKLKAQDHTQAQTDIESYFEQQLALLDANSKKYLLLELTFKNFPQVPDLGVSTPKSEQLAICQALEKAVYGCGPLWNDLYNNLLEGLGPDLQKVLPFIPGIIHSVTSSFPDECKLWLAISLASNTIKSSYDIIDSNSHLGAAKSNTAVHQMLPPDIVSHFHFLAKSSPLMHSIFQSVLSHNEKADPEYDKKFASVPLYEKHLINNQLEKLDENTLCWLLYSLTFNSILAAPIHLKDIRISLPNERAKAHAQVMLTQAQASPTSRLAYIKGIHDKLTPEVLMAFENISKHYVKQVISTLSPEQQSWLYLTLQRNEVSHHQLNFNTTHSYPIEKQQSISKVLHLISLYPSLKELALNNLLEKNKELIMIQPELIDTLGLVSAQTLKPGEFADLIGLDSKKSELLSMAILKKLPEVAQIWLSTSLEKGIIDTQSLLMLLTQAKVKPEEMFPTLMALPNILLLALKHPSIKAGIIKFCGGNSHNIQPLQVIQLDNMPLGDHGFSALCEILSTQSSHLELLSASQCGLSDNALISFYHTLYANSEIKSLNISHNHITSNGYQLLLNHPGTYVNPRQLIMVFSSLWQAVSEPDTLSYLSAYHLTQKHVITTAQTFEALKFSDPKEVRDKFELCNLILKEAKINPTLSELLDTFISKVPLSVKYIQLAHAALQSHDHTFILSTLSTVIDTIQSPTLKHWLKNSLESGEIVLPKVGSDTFHHIFGNPVSQTEIMLTIQASALLLATNLETRNDIYNQLGGNDSVLLPAVSLFTSDGYDIPQNLQCLLSLGRKYVIEEPTQYVDKISSSLSELDLAPQKALIFSHPPTNKNLSQSYNIKPNHIPDIENDYKYLSQSM